MISIDDQHRWQGRATAKAGKKNSGICIVSAWACEQNLVLGGMKTEQKSNERKALPLLVEQLDLHQAVVSIDAIAKRPQTLSAHK